MVPISAFSHKLDALRSSRLVVVVGAEGSGRRSAFRAWASLTGCCVVDVSPALTRESNLYLRCSSGGHVGDEAVGVSDEVSARLVQEGSAGIAAAGTISRPAWLLVNRIEKAARHDSFGAFMKGLADYASSGPSVFVLTDQFEIAQKLWIDNPSVVSLIQWEHVTITEDEGFRIASQHGAVSRDLVTNWVKDMHGWMFGVCLLAQSNAAQISAPSGLPIPIKAFLKYRIFDKLPNALQNLLKATASRAIINKEICKWYRLDDAEELLSKYAEACRGFIRRDALGDFHYSVHPLFRRFLLGELADETRDRGMFWAGPELSHRIADVDATLDVLVACERYDDLARYIDEIVTRSTFDGRVAAAARLLERLPSGVEFRHPVLSYWRALTLPEHEVEQKKKLLMLAVEGFLDQGHIQRGVKAWTWAVPLVGMRFCAGEELDASMLWMEKVERLHVNEDWYLHYPRACCISAVVFAMRKPRHERALVWAVRATNSIALNSTEALGGLVVAGMAMALLIQLDAVRLGALDAWCSSASERLVGPDLALVKVFVHACLKTAAGDFQEAAQLLEACPLCSDREGGIPVCEALLILASSWMGVDMNKTMAERFGPFMKWNSSTSDFYCLKLMGEASAHQAAGDMEHAKATIALAQSLASNIEFPLIADFCSLCEVQHACITGDWHGAKECLLLISPSGAHASPVALLDNQRLILSHWVDANLSTDEEVQQGHLMQLRELSPKHDVSRVAIHSRIREGILAALPKTRHSAVAVRGARGGGDGAADDEAKAALHGSMNRPITIQTFGQFRVRVKARGANASEAIVLQPMLQRVLKFILLYTRHEPLTLLDVCDQLWPQADGDTSKRNFDSVVHRLRNALGIRHAVVVKSGCIWLDPEFVDIDFLRLLSAGESLATDVRSARVHGETATGIVNGRFLLLDEKNLSNESALRKLRTKVKAALIQIAMGCRSNGLLELAIDVYARAVNFVDADPDVVGAWISLLCKTGRIEEAHLNFLKFEDELRLRCDSRDLQRLRRLSTGVD